jgi:hypothetical protein
METIEDELMNLSVEPSISNTGNTEIVGDIDDMKNDETSFLHMLAECVGEYHRHGPRSSKKVDMLHRYLKEWLQRSCEKRCGSLHEYTFELEKGLPSCNASQEKRCDIVVSRQGKPFVVFPVKFTMSNYYQNKNNNWEVLTGECTHLKHHPSNQGLRIVPVNIIFNQVPYLDEKKIIKKWEEITYAKSFQIMENLKKWGLVFDAMNYIVDVQHMSAVGEPYHHIPRMIAFNHETPYRTHDSFGCLWND